MRFSKTTEEAIIKKACSIYDSGKKSEISGIDPFEEVEIFIGIKPNTVLGFIEKPNVDHPIKDEIIYLGYND